MRKRQRRGREGRKRARKSGERRLRVQNLDPGGGFVLTVVMGIKILVSVCMSGLSVNINNNYSISTGDQGVEKGDLAITFGFYGKRDVSVN